MDLSDEKTAKICSSCYESEKKKPKPKESTTKLRDRLLKIYNYNVSRPYNTFCY